MTRRFDNLASETPAIHDGPVTGDDGQRSFRPTTTVTDLKAGRCANGAEVSVAGRAWPASSGASFALASSDDRIEVQLAGGDVPPKAAWVGVRGRWNADDQSLVAASVSFLRPAQLDPADAAARLPECAPILELGRLSDVRTRSAFLTWVRRFCDERGFLEVQTPLLHTAPETANLHQYSIEAVNGTRLFLRTDPEEYLKRYVTAGLEAVYEVSLNVRGEVSDANHLQEFFSLECYRRFMTFEEAVSILDELVLGAVSTFRGSLRTELRGTAIDLGKPIARCTLSALVAEQTGVVLDDNPGAEQLRDHVRRLGGEPGPAMPRGACIEWLLERALPGIAVPTYVVDYPKELGLGACAHPDKPGVRLRGELYLPGGFELAGVYENLTEAAPLRQRMEERLERRLAAGYDAVALDEGLLESAKLGMPPMAGFAVGLDRLLMLVLGHDSIGHGLLFPFEGFARVTP